MEEVAQTSLEEALTERTVEHLRAPLELDKVVKYKVEVVSFDTSGTSATTGC